MKTKGKRGSIFTQKKGYLTESLRFIIEMKKKKERDKGNLKKGKGQKKGTFEEKKIFKKQRYKIVPVVHKVIRQEYKIKHCKILLIHVNTSGRLTKFMK